MNPSLFVQIPDGMRFLEMVVSAPNEILEEDLEQGRERMGMGK